LIIPTTFQLVFLISVSGMTFVTLIYVLRAEE